MKTTWNAMAKPVKTKKKMIKKEEIGFAAMRNVSKIGLNWGIHSKERMSMNQLMNALKAKIRDAT
jgi:hypothetical protein